MKSVLRRTIFAVFITSLTVACSKAEPSSKNVTSETHTTTHEDIETHQPHRDTAHPQENTQDNPATLSRSADSHTHGDAQLAIVLEAGMITIELDSPIYNILGFEHAPETDAQKASLKQAEYQLGRGGDFFIINREAACKIIPMRQKIDLFETHHDEENHYDDHSDDHGHDAHENDDGSDSHKNILLQYEFSCKSPSSVSNINVNLFEFFDKLTEIETTYLGPSTQTQVTLTRKNSKMDIKR